jgi:hypothetical protein
MQPRVLRQARHDAVRRRFVPATGPNIRLLAALPLARSGTRLGSSSPTQRGGFRMVLTLVAELLAGETLLTPGGPVDAVTAAGLEPQFLWQEWTNEVMNGTPPSPTSGLELVASRP